MPTVHQRCTDNLRWQCCALKYEHTDKEITSSWATQNSCNVSKAMSQRVQMSETNFDNDEDYSL